MTHTLVSHVVSRKHTTAITDIFWTLDDISEAFQKALIWLGVIKFEIRELSVCDSHASESSCE